ncbi:unnamed protein product [Bathycoccus prasinos]
MGPLGAKQKRRPLAIRRKRDDESDVEEEEKDDKREDAKEERPSSKKKKKTKKKAAVVALSFEEEEEEEEERTGRLAVDGGQEEKKEEEKRKYDANALKEELEAQRRVALNRPKEHEQEEATLTTAEVNNPFSREAEGDDDDDTIQTVDDGDDQQMLPSNKAILEAKLRRRAKQSSGGGGKNYIPLDVEQKEKNTKNAASLTMMMDIDDEEEDANKQHQAQPSSKRVVIGKEINARSNLALAKLQNAAQNVKRKLDACLENVERSNQASVRSSETLKSYEGTLEESKLRYALAQELGVYFRALSGMLAEKLPMIEELEAQMLETVQTRGKKRKETREHFKVEIGAETSVALHRNSCDAISESELLNAVVRASGCEEVKMDELGRDIEKRCKSRFEAIEDEGAYEKVVSDQFNLNEEDDEKKKKFQERVQSIADIAKNVLFKDVNEEFASASKILEKISEWESKDKKSHDDYLIYLADVFELFARVDLLKSCWITEVFCSSSSKSDANIKNVLVDFPWRKDIVEYISSSQRTKKEKDTSVVALINLKIEVYARTIASLFAKCIADENVWDIFEKPNRVAKAIQRVREDANKTILNERDKIDETKGDKELIDVSHLQELVNEATLNIQHRIDDACVYSEYPFWNGEKYAALVASDRKAGKAIAKTFNAWKENESSSLDLVVKTLEMEDVYK